MFECFDDALVITKGASSTVTRSSLHRANFFEGLPETTKTEINLVDSSDSEWKLRPMVTQGAEANDQEIQNFYQDFPYPPVKSVDEIRDGHLRGNPKLNPTLFFPDSDYPQDMKILIAGCGTNLAGAFSIQFPEARIVGIDISESSISHSQRILNELGSSNCELYQLPLEEIHSLGQSFDFIHCHGVLHHLKSPVIGLKSLGSVLNPNGAMSLMVYAQYGRAGLYQVQELCRRLKLSPNLRDVESVQRLIQAIPPEHALNILYPDMKSPIAIEELADMFLNPRDIAYTTDGIRELINEAELKFHRWVEQGKYSLQASALRSCIDRSRIDNLEMWEEFAMMELFYGTIFKHRFIVTHRNRLSARELFCPDTLPGSIPLRSVDLEHRNDEGIIIITNTTEPPKIEVPLTSERDIALFKLIDGHKSIDEIIECVIGPQPNEPEYTSALNFFTQLYEADIIYLKYS